MVDDDSHWKYAFFGDFYESISDGPTDQRTDEPMDQWTDRPMDIPSYRDARTHLKMMVTKDEVDIWVLGVTRMKYAFWNKSLKLDLTLY